MRDHDPVPPCIIGHVIAVSQPERRGDLHDFSVFYPDLYYLTPGLGICNIPVLQNEIGISLMIARSLHGIEPRDLLLRGAAQLELLQKAGLKPCLPDGFICFGIRR